MAKKLRDAGAILLGKTNMSQWANYRARSPLQPMDGWSAHGGQTYGAYHYKQTPSGSSSGSGVAVDLGLALAALGTETDGSILAPAGWNNVVGIKPTVGLTSRDLVIPISEHHDTVGPMARTVRDAAAILQVIAGVDEYDKYTAAIPSTPQDYVAACDTKALHGARIGVPWKVIEAGKSENLVHEMAGFRAALVMLETAGATIIAANYEATGEDMKLLERAMFCADFGINLAQYLAQLSVNPSGVTSLASLMEQTRSHPREDYAQRNIRCWEQSVEPEFDSADTERFGVLLAGYEEHGVRRGLPGTLERHRLDAMVMPTSMAARWAAMAAAPAISVPLGFYPAQAKVCWDQCDALVETGPGVPYGISFLGRQWSEAKLIGLAYAFEQISQVRSNGVRVVSPPTTELSIEKQ